MDPIVESVIAKLRKRSEIGIKKYGTSLADNHTDDFLKHLQEELMDAVNYIEKIMEERDGVTGNDEVTMCVGNNCPIKESCYRFCNYKESSKHFDPPPFNDGECNYFLLDD